MTPPSGLMRQALDLARQAHGSTSPNPWVGAVLANGGRIVGQGFTRPPGGPHAEIVALDQAGAAARGATLYVTLEPCSHHGRTPPCTDALIAAGVTRVVYSIEDPDARVSGNGHHQLEEAGIEVEVGDGAEDSARLLEAYIKHRRTGLPFVIAKYAASMDGRIAAASGDSRWVSGPATLRWAHEGRTKLDAIMVGVGTVVVDDPQLTARPRGELAERQPLRVVLDSTGRVSPDAGVLSAVAKTMIATTARSSSDWRRAIEATGAEVLVLDEDGDGRVPLPALLRELGARGIVTLLLEGGGVLLGSFFDQRLVDKLTAVIAPMIIGAADAPAAVTGRGAQVMRDAVRLSGMTVERLGDDVLLTGYPEWPQT
jgi:diaminohydroxyphosphoribosylaminopyrimidine deaminase / 5-amino-6-(5-phosphoribosylamino)uracil reductase